MNASTFTFSPALPHPVCEILNTLHTAGYEAYIVGGCVRDLILNRGVISDWDITTSATPSESMALFHAYKVIPTGLKHGTISVIIDGVSYEVTTFRIDGEYRDSRSPESVSFTRSLKEDVARRDFTINALAYSPQKGLIDLVGGLEHLAQKQLVCVGEANKRLNEDALRILRALRFASTLGFSLHSQTKHALFKNKLALEHISKERVKNELEKLICGDYAVDVLNEFAEIIAQVLPEITPMLDDSKLWDSMLLVIQNTPKVPILRWVGLFENLASGKDREKAENQESQESPIQTILTRLRFDGKSAQKILCLIEYRELELGDCLRDVRLGLRDFGEEFLRDWVVFQKARLGVLDHLRLAHIERIEGLIDEVLSKHLPFCLKDLAINGRDLQALGVKNGKMIGEILEHLLSEVIDQRVENDRAKLLQTAQELHQKLSYG